MGSKNSNGMIIVKIESINLIEIKLKFFDMSLYIKQQWFKNL